jgi:hypothetical protein
LGKSYEQRYLDNRRLLENRKEEKDKSRLATTDLAFRNWLDPDERQVQHDVDYANDPEHLCVVCLVVAEDDGEDNTTEVTSRADDTRENTLKFVSI